MAIHPTAIIHPSAQLDDSVEVGPYTLIGRDVVIGAGSVLAGHVVVEDYVRMGRDCRVAPGAVIGGLPQDYGFGGEVSWVEVGDRVQIRECVTVNRATGDGKSTVVGSGSMLMAYSHLAHNVRLGERVTLANSVQLAGYVEVGDDAFIGGTCVVHQHVKVGRMTIIGGFSGTRQDLPPFALTEGRPATVRGINAIGLKRKGIDLATRSRLKRAFTLIWFSGLNLSQAIARIREEIEPDPCVEEVIAFVEGTKRGFRRSRVLHHESDNLPELAERV